MNTRRLFCLAGAFALAFASSSYAQDFTRGRVTGLPIPRFVSMKAGKANVRRGPSTTNRIDWVLRHRGTPLRVVAEYQDWYRVEDVDGEGGWVNTALLSPVRTVLVQQDMLVMRNAPASDAPPLARLEAGVIARLGTCEANWCFASVDRYDGWLQKSGIWGVSQNEVRE